MRDCIFCKGFIFSLQESKYMCERILGSRNCTLRSNSIWLDIESNVKVPHLPLC